MYPIIKQIIFDYDVDSDDEWEEEVEPGESLTDSEGEGEEKEPADDYEVCVRISNLSLSCLFISFLLITYGHFIYRQTMNSLFLMDT